MSQEKTRHLVECHDSHVLSTPSPSTKWGLKKTQWHLAYTYAHVYLSHATSSLALELARLSLDEPFIRLTTEIMSLADDLLKPY